MIRLAPGQTHYDVIQTYDTDGVTLIDADATPTVEVRSNGATSAETATVTKRASTTGIYDLSFAPGGANGASYELTPIAVISGATIRGDVTLIRLDATAANVPVQTRANLLDLFRAITRSDAAAPADLGGTYGPATDSLQAIRDRGDAAWATATGFATPGDLSVTVNPTTLAVAERNAIAAALLAASVDSLPVATLLAQLRAVAAGNVDVVDNGDGTLTLSFRGVDGATVVLTKTYTPATGVRS